MKVTVFGIGYVGLVQAAALADVGHRVLCVDVDTEKVARLEQGEIPIFEPGLEDLVTTGVETGRLRFTTDARAGVQHAELQFIAVGTPPDEDGSADLKYVLAVADTIASHMAEDRVIVTKSTVPVGTADKVRETAAKRLLDRGVKLQVSVVSNPEFLKEGAAVNDCMRPDRIIIGTDNEDAENLLRTLYAPFNRSNDRIIHMDIRSAELTKYAANCMLATKISFMNELANIAEKLGADIEQVRQGIGSDSRIGYSFIYPGCGYGGSCFPKDIQALIRTADQVQFNAELLKSVESVNHRQKQVLFKQISRHFGEALKGKTLALWGLSFKPNTDDMREASSRVLMESLWQEGATVRAYDPESMRETRRIYGKRDDLLLCDSKEAALEGADALVICTEWKTFRAPDFDAIRSSLSNAVIFDGRNMYDPQEMRELGFHYYGIGRGDSVKTSS